MKFTDEMVITEIKKTFDTNDINKKTRFKEDLKADSIDLYQMIIEVEEKFNIEIDDNDAMDIYTVDDLIQVLNK